MDIGQGSCVRLLIACIDFKSYLRGIKEIHVVFMEYEKKNETGVNTKSGLMPGRGGGRAQVQKIKYRCRAICLIS
jgi:hypothetical protein